MASSRRSARRADPGPAAPDADPVLAALARALPEAPSRPLLIGFSGGLDSTVLLDAAVRLHGPRAFVAAHVHHGLQAAADGWPRHCAREASALGVRFELLRLDGVCRSGENLEDWAREARYRALVELAETLGAPALLTAHHADDQVETLLMRIARGTGPDGLAGIRARREHDGLQVLRPLLAVPRKRIEAYALRHGLCHVEDPTNADTARLRNAFRHRVLPVLDEVAPAFRTHLLRLADDLEDARAAVSALAAIDLAQARIREGTGWPAMPVAAAVGVNERGAERGAGDGAEPRTGGGTEAGLDGTGVFEALAGTDMLDADALARLTPARRRAALRHWIAGLGLRAPDRARLLEVERQLVMSAGAHGVVVHQGWCLQRHRRTIFAAPVSGAAVPAPIEVQWRGEAALRLPGFAGVLAFATVAPADAGTDAGTDGTAGVEAGWLRGQRLVIRPGASSVRLRPAPGARNRTMKNLYQEAGVPPAMRRALPLVFIGDDLLYAAGIGMDCSAHWPRAGSRVILRWSPDPPGEGGATEGTAPPV